MRYLGIFFVVMIPVSIYHYVSTRPIAHVDGVLVAKDPRQSDPDDDAPVTDGAFTLQPRAQFVADARVLARERYHMGKLADIAPLDIAAGWGPMSDTAVLARLDISQGNRFYYWHYDNEPPIPREVIETHSANWHLLPANDSVWHALRNIRIGEVVHLEGKLVDIEAPEFGVMRTSMTRTDTGPGACEIIYVESVSVSGG